MTLRGVYRYVSSLTRPIRYHSETVLHTPLQSMWEAASIHQTVLLRERRGHGQMIVKGENGETEQA